MKESWGVVKSLYVSRYTLKMVDDMHDLTRRILDTLSKGPMTPDEVAKSLGISWSTAQGYLLKLTGEGKVSLAKKGRVNVFYLRAPRILRFNVPTWVRVRSLRDLSNELEEYFPEKPSAEEMVEMERRKY